MTTYQQKITFAQMRASGVRDVLIYCRDHTLCRIFDDLVPQSPH